MLKWIFGIIFFLCLISGIVLYFTFYKPLLTQSEPTPKPVKQTDPTLREDRAAFAIFINGKKQDLTAAKFLNRSTDAYLTSQIPDVIFLANSEITWGTFFKTLPMSLNEECITIDNTYCTGQGGTLQVFINSQKQTNFLNTKIIDGDRVLITFGQETPEQISLQMQQVANPLP
jgi:hypothetical protein